MENLESKTDLKVDGKTKYYFYILIIRGVSSTSIMDRQLLRHKVCQIISVRKTNSGVFVLFKTKRELKCQNELFVKYHFYENTSYYVFITEIIWQTFDLIIDDPWLTK